MGCNLLPRFCRHAWLVCVLAVLACTSPVASDGSTDAGIGNPGQDTSGDAVAADIPADGLADAQQDGGQASTDALADLAPDTPADTADAAIDAVPDATETLEDTADVAIDALPDVADDLLADATDLGAADALPDVAADGAANDAADVAVDQAPVVIIKSPKSSEISSNGVLTHFEALVVDPDDAPETLTVVWTSNLVGAPLYSGKASATGISAFDSAALPLGVQVLTATATDPDGKSGIATMELLVNTAPGAPVVAIQPPSPKTTDVLTASIAVDAVDPDRAPGELTYAWHWFKNGVATSNQTTTVAAGTAKKGETWSVHAQAADPYAKSPDGVAEVTIANTAPTAPAVAVAPTAVDLASLATCSVTTPATDADGDSLTYSYVWLVNGAIAPGVTGATVALATLDPTGNGAVLKKGDSLACRAAASDGTDKGPAADSTALTLAAPDSCGTANPCAADADCTNTDTLVPTCVCKAGFEGDGKTCTAITCTDKKQNGDESGVDCGGSNCIGCANGGGCKQAKDCASGHCGGASVCVECAVATDCPGTDNACGKRTCVANACGVSLVQADTVLADQIAGDCKQAQCDGSGGIKQAVLDSDLPDDGLVCTTDICNAGVAANTPVAVGTACSQNGGIQCNVQGACVATCFDAANCPGSDNECQTRTCSAGLCGFALASIGKVVAAQSAGDCKQNQCDGFGNVASVALDSDVFVDGNACTLDACNAGVPANTPMASGSACSQDGGTLCDGQGACVVCVAPSDCPGADTECKWRTCTANKCGVAQAAAGTPSATQVVGDCAQKQCDSQGNLVSVGLTADVHVDNNGCTYDVCTAGKPENPAALTGTPCTDNGGALCDGKGICVGCLSTADCPAAANACQIPACSNNACSPLFVDSGTLVAGQTTGDCKKKLCDGQGNVATILDNGDIPTDGKACTQDLCNAGVPSNPPLESGTSCSQGLGTQCDGNGFCVQCLAATDCPGADTDCKTRSCVKGVCGVVLAPLGTPIGVQTPGDCKTYQCDGQGNPATLPDATDVPVDGIACTADVCNAGFPSNPPATSGTLCSDGGGHVCNGTGTCVVCIQASDCPGMDTACQKRTCVSNACGYNLTPADTPVATQTAGDCKTVLCDGSGGTRTATDPGDIPGDDKACTLDLCTEDAPSNPPVAAGTACTQGGGVVCDGAGSCVDCLTANDCAGTDTECAKRTCTAGACGWSYTAVGTAVLSQIKGDCHESQCSGAGTVIQAILNSDIPVDDNACTLDLCSNGVASNPASPSNTTCSGGVCNGSGSCVACMAPSDCPGSDLPCSVRACNLGSCGMVNVTAGTATASQVSGDCKQDQCDGFGAIISAALDSDVPSDGNACTADLCSGGVPSHSPLASGAACSQAGGAYCDGAGSCVQCISASQCAGTDTECKTRTCNSGTCGWHFVALGTALAQQTAGDCKQNQCDGAGGAAAVAVANDPSDDSNVCTIDACSAGTPTHDPAEVGAPCGTNNSQVCDGKGNCGGCTTPADCPGDTTGCRLAACSAGKCGYTNVAADTVATLQVTGDCQQNRCDGGGGVYTVTLNSDLPVDGQQCTSDICTAGVPSNPATMLGTFCNQGSGSACDGLGACVECFSGSDCPNGVNECQVATCVAGVCGVANATLGTQTASQTAGDCKKAQCDGAGNIAQVVDNADLPNDDKQCTSDLCKLGTPSNPPLAAGAACSQDGGYQCDGAGSCIQCSKPSDCPGEDSTCKMRTCTSHSCGVNVVAAGTPAGTQATGDCQQNQCDGFGGQYVAADTADVPVDGNPCTLDVCSGPVGSNPLAPAGTACSVGGGNVCNSTGVCIGCINASDCPGSDTECKSRICTASTCGAALGANGKVLVAQTAGDCQTAQCDGAGGIKSVASPGDVPVDGKACTADVCSNGVPSNPNLASGASCSENGGAVCDGAGLCVSCMVAADCPGTDTECQKRTCSVATHTCGLSNTASGTVLTTQTAGDCREDRCNGSGGVNSTLLNTDVPVDGNECTQDLCTGGFPSNPPTAGGVACSQNNGKLCNGSGVCVQCVSAGDCPGVDNECGLRTCTAGNCGMNYVAAGTVTVTQTTGDCKINKCSGAGVVNAVADDTDIGYDANQCTNDICSSGVLSHPNADSGTACTQTSGNVCNGSGTCVGCLTATDCPGYDSDCQKRVCSANKCSISLTAAGTPTANQIAGDCRQNQCDGAGNVTPAILASDVPVDGKQCTGDTCNGGVAQNLPLASGTTCNQDGGAYCDGSSNCVACVVASTCQGTDSECQWRFCSNGTCGTSYAASGTPTSVQNTGDCQKNVCNGSGAIISAADNTDIFVDNNACTSDLCTNGTPSNPPLTAGSTCYEGGKMCDGAGKCVACIKASDCAGTDSTCSWRTCTANVCGTAKAASGATCTEGGGHVCDAWGTCVACLKDADCPGTNTDCQTKKCSNPSTTPSCGFTYAPVGTPTTTTPPQTAGDCQEIQCQADLPVSSVEMNTDLPAAVGICTVGQCVTGKPINNAVAPAGTLCNANGGKVCNGIGPDAANCVACVANSDCATQVCCLQADGCTTGPTAKYACLPATCTDKVKNGTETGVDCGGSCGACAVLLALASGSGSSLGASFVDGLGAWSKSTITGSSGSAPALAVNAARKGIGLVRQSTTNQVQATYWTEGTLPAGTWTAPEDVPGVLANDAPSLSASGSNVQAAYRTSAATSNLFFAAYGVPWAPTNEVVGTSANTVPIDIAVTGSTATVVYVSGNSLYAIERSAAGVWGTVKTISTSVKSSIGPRVAYAVGTTDDLFVVYGSDNYSSIAKYAIRTAGTWSTGKTVDSAAVLADRPSLVGVGNMGGLLYRKSGSNAGLYTSFYAAGVWSAPSPVPGTSSASGAPSLVLGIGVADLDVAYIAGGVAYHTRLVANAWSTPVSIGGSSLSGIALARTQ